MKLPTKFLGVFYMVIFATAHAGISTKVLTFDDLSASSSPYENTYGYIPDGYGGLNWTYFGVYNGAARPVTEGYHIGTISPDNVIFNLSGEPASVRSSNPFTLNSAYLTAVNVDGTQIRVEGFVGTTLTYDNTYTLSTTAPTLINFDYTGVDQVNFVPPSDHWFAMDNLTIDAAPEPNTSVLLSVGVALGMLGMPKRKTKSSPML